MPVELFPDPSGSKTSLIRNSESESGMLVALLDRVLETYSSLPWNGEVMRDFVGALRTLATLELAVVERLHDEIERNATGSTRAQLVRWALKGLAEPAFWPDQGGIAPGHKWLNRNFLDVPENTYERIE
jgi:hypothetical protein